jgi:non-specific serine/threonine protein kinase
MGVVFRAEDTRLGRPVALKFLSADLESDPESRARLLREAQAASALRSPYIAVTYDIAEHQGSVFIVMEYVEGELLLHRIERGPIPLPEAVEIGRQTADALDEAHSRGIIHRDLKSANLMLTPRGLVKVLDFGLAKFMESRDAAVGATGRVGANTAAGVVQGTAFYMSPEQALARPLDHRTDLFSLGVVIYQMLTARLPFEGSSLAEVLEALLHRHPAPPETLNAGVPPALSRMVLRALEKDPRQRYQSAREIRDELRALSRTLEAQDPSRTVQLGPPAGKESGGRQGMEAGEPRAGKAVAVMTFSNISREPADDWIGSGIAETVTADLKKIRGLSVIGRARIFEILKNFSSRDLERLEEGLAIDLGRRLGADWIVGGGYQRMGQLVRITAQFVEVRTGTLLKTVKVDGQIAQIFDLQDRIVFELSQGLNLKLESTERHEIERNETLSVEAYECYSRALMNLRAATRESLDRAIYLFEKALEHDPRYAAAFSELGAAYRLKGYFLGMPELIQRAIECEEKALALSPQLASARIHLGMSLGNLGRHEEALTALREAIRIEPRNATAHTALGRFLWAERGLIEEGIVELERAVELNPEMGYAYLQLGLLHAISGNLERAEEVSRQAIELQEKLISGNEGLHIVGAYSRLGYVLYLKGRYQEAIDQYRREEAFLSSSDHVLRERALIEVHQKMGAAYLRMGKPEEAERQFKIATKTFESRVARGEDDPFTRYYLACLHSLRGDAEESLKCLKVSFERLGPFSKRRARTDPDLETIRALPAFRDLLGGEGPRG